MKIVKVLNNNLVICKNNNGKDVVVAGLGIGFQKKKNEKIEKEKIEKLFQNIGRNEANHILEMLNEIPIKYFDCVDKILEINKGKINKETALSSFYMALTDHIYFLIQRISEKKYFPNQFGWEIQRYYPNEYIMALDSIKIIEEFFEISIPEEEASNIALHFMSFNSSFNSIEEKTRELQIVQDIVSIVNYELKNRLNTTTLSYDRFLVHLKFFSQRIFSKEEKEDNNFLYDYVKDIMEDSFKISKVIEAYLYENYCVDISKSQIAYLTVHIQRLKEEEGID